MHHVRLCHFRDRKPNPSRNPAKILIPKPGKPNCAECHIKFESIKTLKEHLQSVHKQEAVACGQCDLSFPNKRLLKIHVARIHDFVCRRCLLKCYSQDKLEEHIKIHENDPANCICRHCGKGFAQAPYLARHLLVRILANCV